MKKPAVAVITVHGVGDHTPGAMSGAIAEQLQSFSPDQFAAFECMPLRIAVGVDGLSIPGDEGAVDPPAKGKLLAGVGARARAATAERHGADATDIAFTAITLAGGARYVDSYSTTRLRCQEKDHDVDLYEMHWADLSHGGTQSGLTALRQMMQLFLHVASLGRTAMSTLLASRGHRPEIPVLPAVYSASAWAYWLLAVPIALGNLMLLCLGAAFLALLIPDGTPGRIGTAAVAAILTGALTGMLFQRLYGNERTSPLVQRVGLPLIWLATIGLAALGLLWDGTARDRAPEVAFLVALPVTLLLGTLLVHRYEISRPGVTKCWIAVLLASFAWGLAAPAVMRVQLDRVDLLNWAVYLIQGTFAWMVIAWIVLGGVNLGLLGTGLYVKRQCRYNDVHRSIDTSLIAASVPAPLLLIVVLALWSGTLHLLKAGNFAMMKTPVGTLFGVGTASVETRFAELIDLSAGPAAIPFLICLTLAFTCAVVALLPSIVAELRPPHKPMDESRSLSLWRWLDQGFRLLHLAKWIAVCAFFLLLPAGIVLQYSKIQLDLPYLGVALGGSALVFLSVTRLFSAVSLQKLSRSFARLRVVIDTAIDVDNWLRERPVGHTPRLRIMARYASLLRFLEEQGYERIVIVSHSQGTVITLDLLRYLRARNPAFLRQLGPIDLLTFGSPLRQLYAARFPAIYGWARKADPNEAGVASWCNGYGSGDYVGRNLWDSADGTPWQPGRTAGQREFCTGAMAHTHYFKAQSHDVAAAITAAIDHAAGGHHDLRGAA